jgi:transposase
LEETIRGWIEEKADLTLVEMNERLAGRGTAPKVSALWHQMNKWGLSLKNAARRRAGTRRRSSGARSLDSDAAVSGSEVAEIHR